jgi:Family of unknown function (DUF6058)
VSGDLAAAVAACFYAVNGRHEMTAEDDAYVSAWYTPLEKLAAAERMDVDELRRLMLANRVPLPSYIRTDGTQMVARDLLELVREAGGADRLPTWFASRWDSPEEAVIEWDDYLSGKYVCLRSVRPENMKRKNQLVEAISAELTHPAPASGEWLARVHDLVDELEELEPPFAPYDRLRFGGPVSRDTLIDDVRRQFPRVALH